MRLIIVVVVFILASLASCLVCCSGACSGQAALRGSGPPTEDHPVHVTISPLLENLRKAKSVSVTECLRVCGSGREEGQRE